MLRYLLISTVGPTVNGGLGVALMKPSLTVGMVPRIETRPVATHNSSNALLDLTLFGVASYTAQSLHAIGQVAQLVERGPEKAGVGGSIPSLATILFNYLASLKDRVKISRAHNTRT